MMLKTALLSFFLLAAEAFSPFSAPRPLRNVVSQVTITKGIHHRSKSLLFLNSEIILGVEFDVIAREWRMKVNQRDAGIKGFVYTNFDVLAVERR